MDYILGILSNSCSVQAGTAAVNDDEAVAWGNVMI
jgi:hypothetical protein